MILRSAIFLCVLFLCQACVKETFFADPYDPRLPGYTENGKNSAGAFINGQAWTVGQREFLDSIYPGAMHVFCDSSTGASYLHISDGSLRHSEVSGKVDLGFHLSGSCIRSQSDLLALAYTEIVLDGVSNFGYLVDPCSRCDTVPSGIGTLYVRHVKTRDTCTIFSGTFGFLIDGAEDAFTVYQGRYDFEICPSQFLE